MKTLYLTDSSANIVVDPDTDFVGTLSQEDRYDIRSIYYMEEPMHIIYNCGECKEEIDAKKGDILLLFYSNRFNKHHLAAIKEKRWVANIKNRRAIEQKEKEEWAARNAETECNKCCNCECPCNACPDVCAPEPTKETVCEKISKALNKAKKAVKKVKKA